MTRILARILLLLVVLAVLVSPAFAKKTLRVMTYNIHVGVGIDKKLDLQRIGDVINRERPDLVGLQEVDRGVKRTEGKDEIAELAAMTRMEVRVCAEPGLSGWEVWRRDLVAVSDQEHGTPDV
jgi:hypothetical protein